MNRDANREADLPQALIDRLRAADRGTPVITARADREVLAEAAAQFAGRPQRWRRTYAWAGAAAAVLAAVLLLQLREPPLQSPLTNVVYADHDGSGRIDIADVLALARSTDRNVSQAELDAFALRVVSLSQPGESS